MTFDTIIAMDSHFSLASRRILIDLSDSRLVSLALLKMSRFEIDETINRFGLSPVHHYLHGQNIGRDDEKVQGYYRYISRYLDAHHQSIIINGQRLTENPQGQLRSSIISKILSRAI